MIIRAKHHFFIHPFFKAYTIWKMKKKFASATITGDYKPNNRSILLIVNHISWWDGFWMMYLNLRRLHKKLHFMMLEDQLRKHWFFKYTGGFSIQPGSRSVVESLAYTRELLAQPGNMVLIFPTGEIQSMHQQIHSFQTGINQILSSKSQSFDIMLVACFVDYFSSPKPHLTIYINTLEIQELQASSPEKMYNDFYEACKVQQCSKENISRSQSVK